MIVDPEMLEEELPLGDGSFLPPFWTRFFQVAGLWNLLVGLPFLLFEDPIREVLGMPPAAFPIFSQMLFAFVILLGWAYTRVPKVPGGNRDIVRLGIAAKLVAFALCVGHAALGNIPLALSFPGIVDLLFVVGFARFLRDTGGEDRSSED